MISERTLLQIAILAKADIQSLIVQCRSTQSIDSIIDKLLSTLNRDKKLVMTVDSRIDATDSGIDQVRKIKNYLKLKDSGRTVIVHAAEQLSIAAQNALLKLLEEPNISQKIILFTDQANVLLPTIRSRCSLLAVENPTLDEYRQQLNISFDSSRYTLSGGDYDIYMQLENKSSQCSLHYIRASELLVNPSHKNLIDIKNYDRSSSILLLNAAVRVMQRAKDKGVASLDVYKSNQRALLKAIDFISKNCNLKLVLSDLFLHLVPLSDNIIDT
jgi:hypothetical protein